ncbi:unnamed protein product [Heligmosomoides polygyrus]|uniref:Antistasin-like domain-containing protein n=1 Tax=Heligmosomoides polygyrus TaxID=6339 RepID=A0A3P8A9K3_HELPZ|nr:unnamed protein product [Heligmosomoides polygyrus]
MTLHVLLLIHVAISVAAAFPPVIEDSCLLRPPRCNLVCTTGYQRGSAGCVCACATDPCQAKLCAVGEQCITMGGVARCLQNIDASRLECPRIIGGICALRCQKDSDCAGKNGEIFTVCSPFSAPFEVFSLYSSQKTLSIFGSAAYTKCVDDFQCPDVEKCCSNACGLVCVDPTKATIEIDWSLYSRFHRFFHLHFQFAPIQCDRRQCWCVDVNYGTEIAGSAVTLSMKRGDMCRVFKLNSFQEIFFDDVFCILELPFSSSCPNGADSCQLIEPDCFHPPCLPVPRYGNCLLANFHPLPLCTCYPVEVPKLHKVIIPQRKNVFQPGDVARHNKGVLSSLAADCPSSFTNCTSACEADENCPGLKRCCRIGCSTHCLYPHRTTLVATSFYSMKQPSSNCLSGEEVAGTRTEVTPTCKASSKCPEVTCRTSCPYEFERDVNGCLTCRCKNPCAMVRNYSNFLWKKLFCHLIRFIPQVKCQQGSFCVMTAVNCFQTENCPPQPRCEFHS